MYHYRVLKCKVFVNSNRAKSFKFNLFLVFEKEYPD